MGATRRVFHLAYSFRQLGFEPVLLAGRALNPTVQTKIDAVFPGIVLRTPHTGYYPRIMDTHPVLRRFCRVIWKLRGGGHIIGDGFLGGGKIISIQIGWKLCCANTTFVQH